MVLPLVFQKTNSSGIATINFTIPWPCENISESEVFGEWYTLANTVIGDARFQDSLTFKVGWIVELISAGEVDEIYVIVKNQGNFTESFNVTLFYDGNIIDTLLVEELESNAQIMLHFSWNTQDVAEGNYTLSAFAIPCSRRRAHGR